jgi:hypothetical protein
LTGGFAVRKKRCPGTFHGPCTWGHHLFYIPLPSSYGAMAPKVGEVRKIMPEIAVKSEALLTGNVSPYIFISPAHGDTNLPFSLLLFCVMAP